MKNLWTLGFALMALALLIIPSTPGAVWAESDKEPSVPTNVDIELTHSGKGNGQARKFAAIVSWDYDPSDDGYVVYSSLLKDDDSPYNRLCMLSGGYDKDKSRITVLAVFEKFGGRDRYWDPSENYKLVIHSVNEKGDGITPSDDLSCNPAHIYPDGNTWGYVDADYVDLNEYEPSDYGLDDWPPGFTDPDEETKKHVGFIRLPPWDAYTSEVLSVPEPEVTPLDELPPVTGLMAVDTPQHRSVRLTWDEASEDDGVEGYVVQKEWSGTLPEADKTGYASSAQGKQTVCILWTHGVIRNSVHDIFVGAYEDTGDQDTYRYSVYPINSNYDVKGLDENGHKIRRTECDGANNTPDSPSATIDVTLDPISTHVVRNGGVMSLSSPERPRNITFSTRTRGSGPARVILSWNGSEFDPGYVARYRRSDATDWIDAPTPTNTDGEPVPTIATNWPRMWGVIGPNPMDFSYQKYREAHKARHFQLPRNTDYDFQVGTCHTLACEEGKISWAPVSSITTASSN